MRKISSYISVPIYLHLFCPNTFIYREHYKIVLYQNVNTETEFIEKQIYIIHIMRNSISKEIIKIMTGQKHKLKKKNQDTGYINLN